MPLCWWCALALCLNRRASTLTTASKTSGKDGISVECLVQFPKLCRLECRNLLPKPTVIGSPPIASLGPRQQGSQIDQQSGWALTTIPAYRRTSPRSMDLPPASTCSGGLVSPPRPQWTDGAPTLGCPLSTRPCPHNHPSTHVARCVPVVLPKWGPTNTSAQPHHPSWCWLAPDLLRHSWVQPQGPLWRHIVIDHRKTEIAHLASVNCA